MTILAKFYMANEDDKFLRGAAVRAPLLIDESKPAISYA
jgi:hypothetical protein